MIELDVWDDSANGQFVPVAGVTSFGYYAVDSGVVMIGVDWNVAHDDSGQALLKRLIAEDGHLRVRHRGVSYEGAMCVATGLGTANGLLSIDRVVVTQASPGDRS
jgi:hypothetical protein